MRSLYSFCLFIFSISILSAQIQLEPLRSNAVLQNQFRTQEKWPLDAQERSTNADILELPFFDDFSYSGPYPDTSLWLDRDVYINNHLAYRPLSIGVATFDGLDETGSPYGGIGAADSLTSKAINLAGLADNDNVYLSFYIQPKGISNFFPRERDTLLLQFLDSASQWVTIDTFQGLKSSTSPIDTFPFREISAYPVTTTRYLHGQFQFRFINHCNRLGLQYLWHLDYVLLREQGSPNPFFTDIAFTAPPNSVLDPYRHIPWNHFNADELRKSIDIELYSHLNTTEEAEPSDLKVKELVNDQIVVDLSTLLQDAQDQRNIGPNEYKVLRNPIDLGPIGAYVTANQEDLVFDMVYSFESGEEGATYPTVKRNNEVHSQTILSNFFAYDDGTPEGIIAIRNTGTQLATQFHSNIADTLKAIQFNFPYAGQNLNGRFNIKIWVGDINSDPVYVSDKRSIIHPELFFDTITAFATYRLLDEEMAEIGIPIPVGNFYIGLEHVSANNTYIGVGYDLNSPDAENFQLYKNSGSNTAWRIIEQPGALMIRPLVGTDIPPTTAIKDIVDAPSNSFTLTIAPNPANDYIRILTEQAAENDLDLKIYNSTGQLLLQQPWEREIALKDWENGLYILQINNRRTGQQAKKKFLILR